MLQPCDHTPYSTAGSMEATAAPRQMLYSEEIKERFHISSNQKHTVSISQFKTAPKGLESLKHAMKIHRTSLQLHCAADSCRGCRSPTLGTFIM